MISQTGDCLKRFGVPDEIKQAPTYLASQFFGLDVDDEGNILVCDFANGLQIFDKNGKFCSTIQEQNSIFTAIHPSGDIVVSSLGVRVFSPIFHQK